MAASEKTGGRRNTHSSPSSLRTVSLSIAICFGLRLVYGNESRLAPASVSGMRDHPAGVRWNWAVTESKKELRSRFQVWHWMETDERSTWMILNEFSSPRARVEVAVPAWITSAEWPGIL